MKRPLFFIVILVGLLSLTFVGLSTKRAPIDVLAAPRVTETPQSNPLEDQTEQLLVEQVIMEAVRAQSENILAYLIYEIGVTHIHISSDGTWAVGLLVLNDPLSGEPAHVEPGLALTRKIDDVWKAILPADSGWVEAVNTAPNELLSDEFKEEWLKGYQLTACTFPTQVFTGYMLPWQAGETRYLSQSTAHDQYETDFSAHYAFDFYVHNTLWPIYASKAGTVYSYKWDIPTCTLPHCDDQPYGNRIVIKDSTTNPVSYQLYLHLAYDSIPEELRHFGAPVAQRQFIGIADNTGQSWGDHLHFQVHTNPDSYWGCSNDIKFKDVNINGGRPRNEGDLPFCKKPGDVCSQTRLAYVAGINGDGVPPYGGLLEPYTGITVNGSTVHLEGYAGDNESGLASVHFIAQYNGAWHDIGNTYTTNFFSLDWNMCADGVTDGPVSIALDITDKSGLHAPGLPGLIHFTKDYSCPVVTPCVPTTDQIAVFTDINYTGKCALFNIGDYPIGSSGIISNSIVSIQVGSNVLTTLYTDDYTNYTGKDQTFTSNDSNLADNIVDAHLTSSLKVQSRFQAPSPPITLLAPDNNLTFPGNASLSLSWRNPGGATGYQVNLQGPGGTMPSDWLSVPFWHLNPITLNPGTYSWQVKARNSAGESGWSSTIYHFTISASTPPPTPVIPPFFDNVEAGPNEWTATGLWNRLNQAERAYSGSYSWYYGIYTSPKDYTYKDGVPNTGDLTSVPIQIPTGTPHLLQFWYRYKTESANPYWDQRWVQVSRDGGPFVNVLQLYDDVPNYYLRATVDLSAYAGSTIQMRFHFETLDRAMNNYDGWFVDDISITQGELPACSDSNNFPGEATRINYGDTLNAVICPAGDIDYYQFSGNAGDRIAVDITGPDPVPTDFDLFLYLLDGDGSSVLIENDDEIPGAIYDPHLGYLLPRTGIYYLKIKQWSHPTAGGAAHTYTINLVNDTTDPFANITYPLSDSWLPYAPITWNVTADDPLSGISRIEFLWHSADWQYDSWTSVFTDTNGADGWKTTFNPTLYPEQTSMAFFVKVYDWAGNSSSAASWNVGIDLTSPVSAMQPLSKTQSSTAVQLEWIGSDYGSGIAYYDLQFQKNGGAWNDILPDPTSSVTQTWFIGDAGSSYGFRIRGNDMAGNRETFQSSAETSTTIPTPATLCSAPDQWEKLNDNNFINASILIPDGAPQIHNLCKKASPDYLNDEDWLKFTAQSSQSYNIDITPISRDSAVILELYAADGTTLLASVIPDHFGKAINLIWYAKSNGIIYIRLRHPDGHVIGNDVSYQVRMAHSSVSYLPLIMSK